MKNARLIGELLDGAVAEARARRERVLNARREAREAVDDERRSLAREEAVASLGDETELRALARFAVVKNRAIAGLRKTIADLEMQDAECVSALKQAFTRRKSFDVYLERRTARAALRDREKSRRLRPE